VDHREIAGGFRAAREALAHRDHRLETSQHAVRTVVPPARRLAVEMRPREDERRVRGSKLCDAINVAHGIDRYAQAFRAQLRDEPVASAAVLGARRETADAASGGGADASKFLQVSQQTL